MPVLSESERERERGGERLDIHFTVLNASMEALNPAAYSHQEVPDLDE